MKYEEQRRGPARSCDFVNVGSFVCQKEAPDIFEFRTLESIAKPARST